MAEAQAVADVGDALAEGRALNRLAVHRANAGNDLAALEDLRSALQACDRAGRSGEVNRVRASVLSNRGQILALRSSFDEARGALLQALELRRQIGDVAGEVITLGHLGYVAHTLGRYGEALERYDQAIERMRQAVDRDEPRARISDANQAGILHNLAAVLHDLGEAEAATKGYREARRRFEAAGDQKRAMAARINEATLEEEKGSVAVAQRLYREAAEHAKETGDRVAEGSALSNLGALLLEEADAGADEVLARARSLLAATGDDVGLARVLQHQARTCRARDDLAGAEALLRSALELQGKVDDRDGERVTLVALASAVRARGRRADAYELYERAVQLVEQTRGELREERHLALRQSYFAQSLAAYDDYCLALVGDAESSGGDTAETLGERAFTIAERRRARELRELLAHAGAESAAASTAQQLETAQQAVLGSSSALLTYVVGGSAGACFCATREAFTFWPLEVGSEDLHQWVSTFRTWAETGASWPAPFARELCSTLLDRPLAWLRARSQRIDRIVIVPDGPLNLLPFSCLPLSDTPLRLVVDDFEIEITPSVGIAVQLASRREGMDDAAGFLGFGEPASLEHVPDGAPELGLAIARRGAIPSPLDHSVAELKAIERLFADKGVRRTKLMLGPDNTKQAAEAAFRPGQRWRHVHFATHGLIDPDVPEMSGLLFSRTADDLDPYWRAPAIATSHVDAELVVASACDTAVGKMVAGEGVLGLARAFLIAGAASVCASLWKVPDSSTAALMSAFYEELLDSRDATAALRAAQLRTRDREQSHPLHWAGFAIFR